MTEKRDNLSDTQPPATAKHQLKLNTKKRKTPKCEGLKSVRSELGQQGGVTRAVSLARQVAISGHEAVGPQGEAWKMPQQLKLSHLGRGRSQFHDSLKSQKSATPCVQPSSPCHLPAFSEHSWRITPRRHRWKSALLWPTQQPPSHWEMPLLRSQVMHARGSQRITPCDSKNMAFHIPRVFMRKQ